MPANHDAVMAAAEAVITAARADRFSPEKRDPTQATSWDATLIGSEHDLPKYGKSDVVSFSIKDGISRLTCTARVRLEQGDVTRRHYDCEVLRVTGSVHADHPLRKVVRGVPTFRTRLTFLPFKRGKNLMFRLQ